MPDTLRSLDFSFSLYLTLFERPVKKECFNSLLNAMTKRSSPQRKNTTLPATEQSVTVSRNGPDNVLSRAQSGRQTNSHAPDTSSELSEQGKAMVQDTLPEPSSRTEEEDTDFSDTPDAAQPDIEEELLADISSVPLPDDADSDSPDSPDVPETLALAIPASKDVVQRDPLQLYLQEIRNFPLLDPAEELELAKRVQEKNDHNAAFRLISSHLRLVVKIAMDFQRRWMQNVLDLVQEGNVGLMRAVQKFDPDRGIKFSYYASFWIKAYILKFIMDNWRLVKVGTTQAQRKLFYNLNRERQRLISQGFDPSTETLAKNLGVSEDVVVEMDQRLTGQDMSLNLPLGSPGEEGTGTRMDLLPALDPGVEETLAQHEIADMVQERIKEILPKLTEKEEEILTRRLLSDSPATLREIGQHYGITRERVRQIEVRLLAKLKKHFADTIQDFSPDWIKEQ